MSSSEIPKPPTGTREPGRRLWESITQAFDLDVHELTLLVEAVRTVDLLDLLDAAVRRDGPLQESPQGTRAHPAAVEARAQKIVLARLLGALRLPSGEVGDERASARPQRRVTTRGTYQMRAVR